MTNNHSNIACISDTHFFHKNFGKKVFEVQMEYFEQVFFPYVLKNNIKNVLHLGDIVHNRNFVDLYLLQELKKRFFQWFDDHKINLHLLIGNHDSYYRTTIEYNFSRSNLNEYQYIHVIDIQQTKNIEGYNICFVPWMTDDNMNLPDITDVDIIAGHFEMKNILMNGSVYSKHGLDTEEFKDYKMVLSGHYHAFSQKSNVTYVGTQYQMNWGDFDTIKGFNVLKDNLELEYIENTTSPKHIKIYYDEQDGCVNLTSSGNNGIIEISIDDSKELIKNNYIKFIVKNYSNQNLLRKYYENLTEHSFDKVDLINDTVLIDENELVKIEDELEEETEFIDVLKNYISKVEFNQNIDKSVLLTKIDDLIEKAKEIDSE